MSAHAASMVLDPQAAEQLARFATFQVNSTTGDVDKKREEYKRLIAEGYDTTERPFEGSVEDQLLRTGDRAVLTRRYTPSAAIPGAAVVYMHGGGWVLGDLDTGDRLARDLALELNVVVLSVHYRRAPEHPFPAAFEDCQAVANQARREFERWCALAGDSAGGNLAAAVAAANGSDHRFDAQLLFYPCLDPTMTSTTYDDYATGFGLTREAMEYYWSAYAGGGDLTSPHLAITAVERLTSLPPTVLVAAGLDVLYDEGKQLCARLIESGVPLTYLPFKSLPHGFAELTDRVDAARSGVKQAIDAFAVFLAAQEGTDVT